MCWFNLPHPERRMVALYTCQFGWESLNVRTQHWVDCFNDTLTVSQQSTKVPLTDNRVDLAFQNCSVLNYPKIYIGSNLANWLVHVDVVLRLVPVGCYYLHVVWWSSWQACWMTMIISCPKVGWTIGLRTLMLLRKLVLMMMFITVFFIQMGLLIAASLQCHCTYSNFTWWLITIPSLRTIL